MAAKKKARRKSGVRRVAAARRRTVRKVARARRKTVRKVVRARRKTVRKVTRARRKTVRRVAGAQRRTVRKVARARRKTVRRVAGAQRRTVRKVARAQRRTVRKVVRARRKGVAGQVDRMIPKPAKVALAKAESALTQTVAAVRQSAVQAGTMASTAQAAVGQQASLVMDQAKDFVKRVGESVGNIVEGGAPGDSKK